MYCEVHHAAHHRCTGQKGTAWCTRSTFPSPESRSRSPKSEFMRCLAFRDSGFEFWGPGFAVWDPGFRIRASGSRIWVPGVKDRKPESGSWVSGFRIRDPGFGFRDSEYGIRDSGAETSRGGYFISSFPSNVKFTRREHCARGFEFRDSHTQIHINIHIYIHIHTQTHIHIHQDTQIYAHEHVHIRTHDGISSFPSTGKFTGRAHCED